MQEAHIYAEAGQTVYLYEFNHWNDELETKYIDHGIQKLGARNSRQMVSLLGDF